ncbi:hypothetical protein, partial [Methylobacillus sp. MM3]|uniref:hypothetical protein n=1 Tax=Methylobacillus sp. MM3 TaxID=1848039 RepID=UPI000AAB4754
MARNVDKGDGRERAVERSAAEDVARFLAEVKATRPAGAQGRGRLIFALDATMSRQPTWDMAMQLQTEMFLATSVLGGLDVQLMYYRGFGECRASRWVRDGGDLSALMQKIAVAGGQTQIRRILAHARDETRRERVQALVFVGDAMEE